MKCREVYDNDETFGIIVVFGVFCSKYWWLTINYTSVETTEI